MTRAEGMQQFHRALGHAQGLQPMDPVEVFEERVMLRRIRGTPDMAEELRALERQYPSTGSSNANIMQRFVMVNPMNEPFPLHGRRALSDGGIDYGSLEHAEVRAADSDRLFVDYQSSRRRHASAGADTLTVPPAEDLPSVPRSSQVAKRKSNGSGDDSASKRERRS